MHVHTRCQVHCTWLEPSVQVTAEDDRAHWEEMQLAVPMQASAAGEGTSAAGGASAAGTAAEPIELESDSGTDVASRAKGKRKAFM